MNESRGVDPRGGLSISRRRFLRDAAILAGLTTTGGLLSCSTATQPQASKTAAPAVAVPTQASSTPSRPLKLDFAALAAPPEITAAHMQWFTQEVTKRTNGSINMAFHGGTLLTKEVEIADAVKSGSIAAGTPGGATTTIFPELAVLLVPYLFRDYDHAYNVLEGDIGKDLIKQVESKYDVKFLFWYDLGFREFLTTRKPIKTPDDMKGMKLRVMPGATYAETVSAFGASAVTMGWAEVITAAQSGVIDGFDLPAINVVPTKANEVIKYVTMSQHNFSPILVPFNLRTWQSLTSEEQKTVQAVALETTQRIRKDFEAYDKNAKTSLGEKGLEVFYPDLEPFRKIAKEKVWPKYRATAGDLLDRIAAVK